MNYLSQVEYPIPRNIRGFGPYGLEGRGASTAPSLFNVFLTSVIGLLTVIAGVYFFFVLVTGAIAWIGSGGDRGKIEAARERITTGLIGMAVVVAAVFIIEIVGNILGLPSLLDPATVIRGL